MTTTPDHEASPTPESADRAPLERAARAIDEGHEAARKALQDPSPAAHGTASSQDPADDA